MLRGEKRDDLIERGNPQSGFYRDGNKRAVAIWRDENGALQWSVTAGYNPRHEDEIDEVFGFVLSKPISREIYMAHAEGKGWPEDVPAAGRIVEKTDNNPPEELTPDRALAAEIVALETQCRAWLMTLPGADAEKAITGKPSNKVEADTAANYSAEFLKFEQRATEAHKTEKAPHLEAGKAIDAKWFVPIRDKAKTLKEKIKEIGLAWSRAEDARKSEDARKANEELRRIADEANRKVREEADKIGAAPPPVVKPVEVVAEKTKIGTGRVISARTETRYVVEDWRSVANFFASVPEPAQDLKDVLQKLTNVAMKAGLAVPSVKTVKE
jgi:hypothetical protein